MRDLEDEARIKAYMAAKMKHIKMYNECMNLADGLDVEKFAGLVRADEREACASLCSAVAAGRDAEAIEEAIRARGNDLQTAIERGTKAWADVPDATEWVDDLRGNVDAVNMSQERVDKTAKGGHEPVAWADKVGAVIPHSHKLFQPALLKDYTRPLYTAPQREWVGLTDDEIAQLMFKCDVIVTGPTQFDFAQAIEAKLKEKNR